MASGSGDAALEGPNAPGSRTASPAPGRERTIADGAPEGFLSRAQVDPFIRTSSQELPSSLFAARSSGRGLPHHSALPRGPLFQGTLLTPSLLAGSHGSIAEPVRTGQGQGMGMGMGMGHASATAGIMDGLLGTAPSTDRPPPVQPLFGMSLMGRGRGSVGVSRRSSIERAHQVSALAGEHAGEMGGGEGEGGEAGGAGGAASAKGSVTGLTLDMAPPRPSRQATGDRAGAHGTSLLLGDAALSRWTHSSKSLRVLDQELERHSTRQEGLSCRPADAAGGPSTRVSEHLQSAEPQLPDRNFVADVLAGGEDQVWGLILLLRTTEEALAQSQEDNARAEREKEELKRRLERLQRDVGGRGGRGVGPTSSWVQPQLQRFENQVVVLTGRVLQLQDKVRKLSQEKAQAEKKVEELKGGLAEKNGKRNQHGEIKNGQNREEPKNENIATEEGDGRTTRKAGRGEVAHGETEKVEAQEIELSVPKEAVETLKAEGSVLKETRELLKGTETKVKEEGEERKGELRVKAESRGLHSIALIQGRDSREVHTSEETAAAVGPELAASACVLSPTVRDQGTSEMCTEPGVERAETGPGVLSTSKKRPRAEEQCEGTGPDVCAEERAPGPGVLRSHKPPDNRDLQRALSRLEQGLQVVAALELSSAEQQASVLELSGIFHEVKDIVEKVLTTPTSEVNP